MKLILAILSKSDAPAAASALTKAGYPSTVTNSYGGFLQKENAILLSGVDDTKVRYVINILAGSTSDTVEQVSKENTGSYKLPNSIKVSGASIFVLDVDQHIRL